MVRDGRSGKSIRRQAIHEEEFKTITEIVESAQSGRLDLKRVARRIREHVEEELAAHEFVDMSRYDFLATIYRDCIPYLDRCPRVASDRLDIASKDERVIAYATGAVPRIVALKRLEHGVADPFEATLISMYHDLPKRSWQRYEKAINRRQRHADQALVV